MGLFNKIFGIFKQKEVVNEETVTEKVISNNEENPIVVSDTTNTPVMVRADDFQDSSVTPEEYKVANEDEEIIEEAKVEETVDHGIDVSEGDDMTPIIMDVEGTTEVVEEVIEPAEEVVEETLEVVEDVPKLIENIEDNTEVIEEAESIETDEEVEVIGSEETLEEEIEVL